MTNPLHFLIIHGTHGNPGGNWFPWLKAQLEKAGHSVSLPNFPTPEGQSFNAWRDVALPFLAKAPAAQTVLVGHSIAGAFMFRLLEETNEPYRAIFAVSPFTCNVGLEEFRRLNASFVEHDFDWPRVKAGAQKIVCFAGDDDPYVPLDNMQKTAADAGANMILIKGGKHLNAEAGYTSFPLLYDEIQKLLKEHP